LTCYRAIDREQTMRHTLLESLIAPAFVVTGSNPTAHRKR